MYITSAPETEAQLEKATVKALKEQGMLTYKFTSPNRRGVPDDIVLLPNGKAVFVEFKSPTGGGKLSRLQDVQIEKIERQGFMVFIVSTVNEANDFVYFCVTTGHRDHA